jgi:DNA-binding NarL/FixJ family response regulator
LSFGVSDSARIIRRNSHANAEEEKEFGIPAAGLTARQEEIARLVVRGLSNLEIAARLQTKEATVKSHLQNIFRKTGIQRRSQLIGLFLTLAALYPDS